MPGLETLQPPPDEDLLTVADLDAVQGGGEWTTKDDLLALGVPESDEHETRGGFSSDPQDNESTSVTSDNPKGSRRLRVAGSIGKGLRRGKDHFRKPGDELALQEGGAQDLLELTDSPEQTTGNDDDESRLLARARRAGSSLIEGAGDIIDAAGQNEELRDLARQLAAGVVAVGTKVVNEAAENAGVEFVRDDKGNVTGRKYNRRKIGTTIAQVAASPVGTATSFGQRAVRTAATEGKREVRKRGPDVARTAASAVQEARTGRGGSDTPDYGER